MGERKISWEQLIDNMLATTSKENLPRFDVNNDDEILCRSDRDASCIVDFLKALGFDAGWREDQNEMYYKYEIYTD